MLWNVGFGLRDHDTCRGPFVLPGDSLPERTPFTPGASAMGGGRSIRRVEWQNDWSMGLDLITAGHDGIPETALDRKLHPIA